MLTDDTTDGLLGGLAEHERSRAVARYERLEPLGRGGMAAVFRGRDRQLNRVVAIKALHPELAQSHVRERFVREATAVARLSHPNIVKVHDVGEEAGVPFIVMELVEGGTLGDAFRAWDVRRRVEALRKVALAVDHAHRHGVVHRDLKPGNILVDASGEPRVADFGLAHVEAERTLTRTGAQLGTPVYMAPEQVAGRTKEIDARTDVWALGVMLYEALAGRPPFLGATLPAVYERILSSDPAPLGAGDVETICLKAMDKERGRRYATAREFADDLARYLAGEPVAARPPSVARRAWRSVSRHRVAAAIAGVLVAAAVAVFAVARGSRERLSAQAEALRLIESARPAVEEARLALYRRDADLEQVRRRADAARPALEEAVARAPDLPLAHHMLGRLHAAAGRPEQAEACWRRAVTIDARFGPSHLALGRSLLERARAAWTGSSEARRAAGKRAAEPLIAEAARAMQRAVESRASLDGALEGDLAEGFLAFAQERREDLRRIAAAGIERWRGRAGVEEFHLLAAYGAEGGEAEAALTRAIDACPRFAAALFNRAALRRGAAAIEDYTAAIDAAPWVAEAWSNRGVLRLEAGDARDATEDFDRAIGLRPAMADAFHNRGNAKRMAGDADGAMADYARAIELDASLADARVNRAGLRLERGDIAGASEDLERALEAEPGSAKAYCMRGALKSGQRDHDGAIADYTKALECDEKCFEAAASRGVAREAKRDLRGAAADYALATELNPSSPTAWLYLADAHRQLGEWKPAAAALDRALALKADWLEALEMRAEVRGRLGDRRGMVADLRAAARLGSSNAAAALRRLGERE